MTKPYKASPSKNQGRHSYSIIFRHPVRKDPNTGKPGRCVRAGLKTKDEAEVNNLVEQMNENWRLRRLCYCRRRTALALRHGQLNAQKR